MDINYIFVSAALSKTNMLENSALLGGDAGLHIPHFQCPTLNKQRGRSIG